MGSRTALTAVLAPYFRELAVRPRTPGANGSGKSRVLRIEGVVVGETLVGHKEAPLLRDCTHIVGWCASSRSSFASVREQPFLREQLHDQFFFFLGTAFSSAGSIACLALNDLAGWW